MATTTVTKTARIDCVNKSDRPNPHERITHVGGTDGGGWKTTQEHAIELIERGEWGFHTYIDLQKVEVIIAKSRWGNKYLKTEADGEQENNLLVVREVVVAVMRRAPARDVSGRRGAAPARRAKTASASR